VRTPALCDELAAILDPARVLAREIDRIAFAADASFYRLVPEVVVQPASIAEIQALFALCRRRRLPLTFRTAGTSLSGQAVTRHLLVDVSRHFGRVAVEARGERVRVEPGVIGGHVNRVLAPYARRIGPDPASIDSCMMGGILANNSSGMCCGVENNAYRTLVSLRFVLPSGLALDTALPEARRVLEEGEPEIARGLLELRRRVQASPSLCERIRKKYRIKNTMGYSMNAFLDFEEPQEILSHLLIGSEGTLAFIAEAVLRTLPDPLFPVTGLLYFADVPAACRAIEPLRASGVRAVEIMDRASLRAVENEAWAPAILRELPDRAAALLVEYGCARAEDRPGARRAAEETCARLPLLAAPAFTDDGAERAGLWRIRKGLFPSVGALRPPGSTVLMEDVAFPAPRLADAVTDLQELFRIHGYEEAIIFGHAKDGNLHFVLTPSFGADGEVERYERFTDDLVRMVLGHEGSLKAEHGTGRNMAPFVEAEWGAEAYARMRELKALIDPDGILNPGVILNDDPRVHVRDLKDLPHVEEEADRCIECGFCEARCPSRRLTLTPRQRIVVRREMARRGDPGGALGRDFVYAGLDTCAADGMCATACPVHIDTGALVKRLRAERIGPSAQRRAQGLVKRFALLELGARETLRAGHLAAAVIGPRALGGMLRAFGLPRWTSGMPRPSPRRLPPSVREGAHAVYFPTCVSRILGVPMDGGRSLPETMLRIAERARFPLWIPEDCPGHCCGMPFGSKGYADASREMLEETVGRLWEWTDGGRLPVVLDGSSCVYTMRSAGEALAGEPRAHWKALRILDAIELVSDVLLERLPVRRLPAEVVVHPNCGARKLGLENKLLGIVRACANRAEVPLQLECCAMAGDRGLRFPELTAAALAPEAAEVRARPYQGHYSCNIPCEMALSTATGRPYRSFLYLVDEATRGGSPHRAP
jgi:D-lactate dehydrogenase